MASLKRVQQLQSALTGVHLAASAAGAAYAGLVVAGDFNSTPESVVAAYLSFGTVPPGARDAWGLAGATEASEEVVAVPAHTCSLQSVYGLDDPNAFSFAPNGRQGWHGLRVDNPHPDFVLRQPGQPGQGLSAQRGSEPLRRQLAKRSTHRPLRGKTAVA